MKIDIYNPPLPKINIYMPWIDHNNDKIIQNFYEGDEVYIIKDENIIVPDGFYEIVGFNNVEYGRFSRNEGIKIEYNNKVYIINKYSNIELSNTEYIVYDKIYSFIRNFFDKIDTYGIDGISINDMISLFDIDFKNEFIYINHLIQIKSIHGKNDINNFYFSKEKYNELRNFVIQLRDNYTRYLNNKLLQS